jgi:hypothetical protein
MIEEHSTPHASIFIKVTKKMPEDLKIPAYQEIGSKKCDFFGIFSCIRDSARSQGRSN